MNKKFKKLKNITILQKNKIIPQLVDDKEIVNIEIIKEEKQSMDTEDAIELLSKLENNSKNISQKTAKVKRINKPIDGLFERTESSKIIITENNKQVLND